MNQTYFRNIARSASAVLLLTAASWQAHASDYSTAVLGHNPVAYWQFKEAAASPTPLRLANSGSLGSVADAYGNALLVNGVPGIVGNALQFQNATGTAHAGSRADIVYNSALSSPTFTVEFWVQPSATVLGSTFDSTGSSPLENFNPNNYAAARVGWLFYVAPNGKWNFRLGLTSGYAVNLVASSGLATAGVWQHIAATYDGTNVNLYANGALIGTKNAPSSTTGWVPNTGAFLRIGGTPLYGDSAFLASDGSSSYYAPLNQGVNTSGNRGFDGLLDEIAIYTNALPSSAIASHYAAASTPASYGATIQADNPAGYWNFNESAITAPDSSALVVSTNSGTIGSEADGTNQWGVLTAQPGPGYPGFPADDKALTFNGVSGSFDVKDANDLHFTGQIALAAWVKLAARDGIREIISHGLSDSGAETFLRISRGSGYGTGYYYEFGASDGVTATGNYDSATASIPDGDIGSWVFLVGSFDGNNWNLYRNGKLAATYPETNGISVVDLTGGWTLGARQNPSDIDGFRFAGSIAEPAIFNQALSATDVQNLYNAAKAPPTITLGLQSPGAVFKGADVSFSVWAEGAPTLTYTWSTNGVSTGVTSTNFTLHNIGGGTYTVSVAVANAYGTNTSSVTFTSQAAPPSIITGPASLTRFAGYPFSFSVNAGGSQPLTYIWKLNSTIVQSGSSSNYQGTASLANAGSYTVTVTNETGVVLTSDPAILTVLAVPGGYAGTVISNGPIAYWRLDEAPGSTVAHDAINGYNGVYNNTILGVQGYSIVDNDTAAEFGGANSYVGGISGTAINFTGHTNFSIEAWVNASGTLSDESTIIAKGIGATGTTRTEQFSLDVASGVYRFFTTGGSTLYAASATSGPNGTWQHIVAVYDDLNTYGGASGQLYIYVNGELQGSAAVRPAGLNGTVSDITIGSKRTGNDPSYDGTFDGDIDEVAIYNRALTADEIKAHYDATYGFTLAPFVQLQPASVTNYVGLSATFSVAAAGSVPLTYQWRKNGVDIPGATTDTLTLTPLAYTDAGQYTVAIVNGVGTTITTNASLVVLAPPTTPPAIPGLVVHLPFTHSSLTDTTGRGNNGHAVGSPTFVTDGVLGTALHYETTVDTTGTKANYVSLGVRPDLNFSSNVSFTVAFWVRLPANYQGGDLPFFTDATNSTFAKGYVFAPSYGYYATQNPETSTAVDGAWAYSVFDGNSAGVGGHGDDGNINDGAWHHLAYVIDRQNGSVVYLDGLVSKFTRQQGTSAKAAEDIYTGAPATIGQDPSGQYGEAGSADIQDLGVWRRALTPLEVGSIYSGGASNQISFTGAPITLSIQSAGTNKATLNWSAGTLQSADTVNGAFTDVSGAVPPYTLTVTNAAKFYRVKF